MVLKDKILLDSLSARNEQFENRNGSSEGNVKGLLHYQT